MLKTWLVPCSVRCYGDIVLGFVCFCFVSISNHLFYFVLTSVLERGFLMSVLVKQRGKKAYLLIYEMLGVKIFPSLYWIVIPNIANMSKSLVCCNYWLLGPILSIFVKKHMLYYKLFISCVFLYMWFPPLAAPPSPPVYLFAVLFHPAREEG